MAAPLHDTNHSYKAPDLARAPYPIANRGGVHTVSSNALPRKLTIAITALACAGVLALLVVGAVFCANTLHVGRRLGPPPPHSTAVSLHAPTDGAPLQAWWVPNNTSPTPNRCVLILHGIADSHLGSAGFAPMFLQAGYSVLLPDSRAHGASGGAFVTYGLLERSDTLAWIAWMKRAGCRDVYALGESYGASILIQTAGQDSTALRALVAECPFADLRSAAEYRATRLTRSALLAKVAVESGLLYARFADGLDFRDVSPLRAIAHTTTPILLIHGLADTRTPSEDSHLLWRANPRNTLWLVPGAPHTAASGTAPQEFQRRVLGWFAAH